MCPMTATAASIGGRKVSGGASSEWIHPSFCAAKVFDSQWTGCSTLKAYGFDTGATTMMTFHLILINCRKCITANRLSQVGLM